MTPTTTTTIATMMPANAPTCNLREPMVMTFDDVEVDDDDDDEVGCEEEEVEEEEEGEEEEEVEDGVLQES